MNKIIPLPNDKGFDDWVRLLTGVYSDQPIPLYVESDTWQNWVSKLRQLSVFNAAPIPSLTRFPNPESWKEWVPFFIQSMT